MAMAKAASRESYKNEIHCRCEGWPPYRPIFLLITRLEMISRTATGPCLPNRRYLYISLCLSGDFARILEKQNRLQMSQVFPFRASMIKWALLFKDSMSGTEERVNYSIATPIVNARTDPKTKRCPLHSRNCPDFYLNKFRSRISEAASTQAMLLPRGLAN